MLVQPETLLRWHRAGFCALWRRKSRPGPGRPPLPAETIALIRRMDADNPRWGAERIRGELGKLGIRVAKRTIQTYLRTPDASRPRGQAWATFLRNHAHEIWACDFLSVTDLCFRPMYAFFVIALGSRRVVHLGVTRHPTDAWVAQQLREATPFDQRPRYLVRDNDGKFGSAFARVAATSDINILRTPPARRRRMPSASASWAVSAVNASTICSFWARANSIACSGSTSRISTGHARIRASAKRRPSHLPRRTGVERGQYARCLSWAASTISTGAPREANG